MDDSSDSESYNSSDTEEILDLIHFSHMNSALYRRLWDSAYLIVAQRESSFVCEYRF